MEFLGLLLFLACVAGAAYFLFRKKPVVENAISKANKPSERDHDHSRN